MNRRQIFSIHIVLKCQRRCEAQTFAPLQYFCTFVIEIKDRMQYCMEEPKRGCRARALSIGTRWLYALRAALRASRAGVNMIIRCYRLNARPCFFFFFFLGGGVPKNKKTTICNNMNRQCLCCGRRNKCFCSLLIYAMCGVIGWDKNIPTKF